jgi:hypothetical protein
VRLVTIAARLNTEYPSNRDEKLCGGGVPIGNTPMVFGRLDPSSGKAAGIRVTVSGFGLIVRDGRGVGSPTDGIEPQE